MSAVSHLEPEGPVALVGSGEFLAPDGRRRLRAARRAPASGPCSSRPPPRRKGPSACKYWIDLGTAHYEAMGVEPVPLAVLDRDDAERADLAAQVAGAGLVYLSGGNPGYLAHTLAGTAVWRAILEAWRSRCRPRRVLGRGVRPEPGRLRLPPP